MPARPVLLLLALLALPSIAQEEDPAALLRLAQDALGARRMAEAAEHIERAEARLLTRGEVASDAGRPAVGGPIGELAAARDALSRGDRVAAASLIGAALRWMEQGEWQPAAMPDAEPGPEGKPKDPRPLPVAKPPALS